MEAMQNLADALRLAERAHALAELATPPYKGQWPEFYAQWLIVNLHLWTKHGKCEDGSCEVHDDDGV